MKGRDKGSQIWKCESLIAIGCNPSELQPKYQLATEWHVIETCDCD